MATKLNEFTAAEMRSAMIDCQLRPSNVTDARVVAAMGSVARENFVPANLANVAYIDRPVSLGAGRLLNAPLVTGRMLVEANVQQGDRVLLIGAGTGYVAALLTQLGAEVVAVEEQAALTAAAPADVKDGSITWVEGALADGAADKGPYQLILIDGAIEVLPDALVAQLAEGGKIVTARSEGAVSRLVQGVKANGTIALQRFADMDVAALPGFEAPKGFQF